MLRSWGKWGGRGCPAYHEPIQFLSLFLNDVKEKNSQESFSDCPYYVHFMMVSHFDNSVCF